MAPIYVERRKKALRTGMGASVLALIGIFAGPTMIEEIKDSFKETICTGNQTIEAMSGDTFDSLANNVAYDNSRISKDDVVYEVMEMNPSTKPGSIIVGQLVELPAECYKN